MSLAQPSLPRSQKVPGGRIGSQELQPQVSNLPDVSPDLGCSRGYPKPSQEPNPHTDGRASVGHPAPKITVKTFSQSERRCCHHAYYGRKFEGKLCACRKSTSQLGKLIMARLLDLPSIKMVTSVASPTGNRRRLPAMGRRASREIILS